MTGSSGYQFTCTLASWSVDSMVNASILASCTDGSLHTIVMIVVPLASYLNVSEHDSFSTTVELVIS